MEQVTVKVLTAEEYSRHKNPAYDTMKFVEKLNKAAFQKLKERVEYLEGIIDLKYDKEGNAIFTSINDWTFPKNSKFK